MFKKNSRPVEIRSAAILTNNYVAGTIIDEAHDYNQLSIRVLYTKGSLTSLELKVEYSDDGVDYAQDVNISPSAGVNTIVVSSYTYSGASADFTLDFPINANFIRVSAKGTGTVDDSSLELTGMLALV